MFVTYMKLLLYIVAMQIQAIVVSWNQRLFVFVAKRRRQAFCPFLNNDFCLSVTPQILAGQKFLELEKQVIESPDAQSRYCMEDAQKFPQLYCSNAHFVSREAY